MSTDHTPKYWQSLEALAGDPETLARAQREFAEDLPVGPADAVQASGNWFRRDFFKVMGLSAAAFLAACKRAPVKKVIPFVDKPEEMTPGVPSWYASTCGGCAAGCGVLLKTRDGRPIKVEGNESNPWSSGGVCAVGHATVLALYDASRARGPLAASAATSWGDIDAKVAAGLKGAADKRRLVRLVVPFVLSPSNEAVLAKLFASHPEARIVRHDPTGDRPAIAAAHKITHGVYSVPSHRFDKAKVIVSVGADFLNGWLSPVVYSRQYVRGRDLSTRAMSRHWQLESLMTLTGSNADRRVVIGPTDEVAVLAAIAGQLAIRSEHPAKGEIAAALGAIPKPELDPKVIVEIADELWAARGAALLVSGSTDPAAQVAVNAANELLDSYGHTVTLEAPSLLDDKTITFDALLAELREGKVGVLVYAGVNPVYDHPAGLELRDLTAKVELSVSTGDRLDETGKSVQLLAPDHHYLEAWDDAAPTRGIVSMRQPAVQPLWDTRSVWESLLKWAGVSGSYRDFMKKRWEDEVFVIAEDKPLAFRDFWERSVRDGLAIIAAAPIGKGGEAPTDDLGTEGKFRATGLSQAMGARSASGNPTDLSVVLYQGAGIRDGAMANNGWLQELPDPIAKTTWTNFAAISPKLADGLGLRTGSMVSVTVDAAKATLPVVVVPGTHPRAIGIALGYGRVGAGPLGDGVGANGAPLARFERGRIERTHPGAKLAPTGQVVELAISQTHASLEGRPHVKETTLEEFVKNPRAGNEEVDAKPKSIWSLHNYDGHRWAMSIDLTACTGCASCVVSCQAENNIPIVGADEVRRGRDMFWMRIDRYFAGTPESPTVVHQPMLCQHCENAPCETVCPVLATVHSSEGLNQQAYNRCVGTRYCANNCPPKVRRFNWFDYHATPQVFGPDPVPQTVANDPTRIDKPIMAGPAARLDDPVSRMVLNPDVVVRSRGVMEKCSMCVQRIYEGKATAKRDGRKLRDGEIKTACQQSCPTQAIVFGDIHDPESRVAKLAKDARAFRILVDVNIESSIRYMTKVRNTGQGAGPPAGAPAGHAPEGHDPHGGHH